MEIIGLASDHAGYEMKDFVKWILEQEGYQVKDFGTDNSTESCDYADYAHPLALAVENGEVNSGIAVCGSGNGINMTLNKHQGIRSALCWNTEIAKMARAHNDANVMVLPGRYISNEIAAKCIDAYLNTSFEGGRHLDRINKMPVK